MSGNAGPEVELTRGLGIGIGIFIALFAAAIVAFALHLGGDAATPAASEAQAVPPHAVAGDLATGAPRGSLTRP